MGIFPHVIESSGIGARKPGKRLCQITLETAEIPANEASFLDDLSVNLKRPGKWG